MQDTAQLGPSRIWPQVLLRNCDPSVAGAGSVQNPLHRASDHQDSWPPHLRGEAEQHLEERGREGGRQESPLLPENTCQPKAGASMRCKNDRNVMLCLHNCKTVQNTAVNPHPAPSSLGTSCHEGFPTWGWRFKCKSHLWHPLNNSFTLPDPRLCWPRIQGVPHSQTHPSDFRNPENTCRDVHVLTWFAVWPSLLNRTFIKKFLKN